MAKKERLTTGANQTPAHQPLMHGRAELQGAPVNGGALDAEFPSRRGERRTKGARPAKRVGRLRYDRPGHLDEGHAERLLRLSGPRGQDRELAFILDDTADDELATELAEHTVLAMTAGGDSLLDSRDEAVEEERGGPFLETRAAQEFARGGARATAGFFREALPTSGAQAPEFAVPWSPRARKP